MKKIFVLLSLLTVAACGKSPLSSGETLVKVGSEKITEGELQFLTQLNPGIARQLSNPFGKQQVIENLVEQELFYQAAKKEGLDRDAKVAATVDFYKKVIVAKSYIEAAAAEEAEKYYNENKQEFERVELAHILVPTVEKANALLDQIKKGADFFETAKKESQDKMSQPQGGRLGMVSRNEPGLSRMGFEPILEQAFTAKIGEVAGPIKTTAGYHLILVTSPVQIPLFDEVKPQLVMHKKRELHDKLLSDLKTSTKIVYANAVKPEEPKEKPTEEKGPEIKTEGQKAPAEVPPDHPQPHPTSESSQP